MDESSTYLLARTLVNEAGVCGIMGMVAVAYVWTRNKVMYGSYGPVEPTDDALFVARYWSEFPDYSRGAKFVFSDEDLRDWRVQNIIRNHGPPWRMECAGGLGLNFVGSRPQRALLDRPWVTYIR